MKSIAKIFAASLVTLLGATAIAQSAAAPNSHPGPDPSTNIRLQRLERMMQPAAKTPSKEAAESPEPEVATTIRTGTLIYNFTIQLSTPQTGNDVICYLSLGISDAGTGSYFDETGEAYATVSGSTAHCTVKIPYSWVLATSSVATDMVTGYYSVTEYTGATTGMYYHSNSHELTPINVPANGATTSSGFLPRT